MGLLSFCEWLNQTPFSVWLREAPYPFPILIIVHVISVALFGGIVVMGNLRVLGWALRGAPVSQIIGQFRAWKWLGLAILLISGLGIAASDPLEYYGNIMWWISLGMLALAGVNAAIFRYGIYRSVAEWDDAVVTPEPARRWAGCSLGIWIALIFIGRAIAFF